jgi:hypothetical protein
MPVGLIEINDADVAKASDTEKAVIADYYRSVLYGREPARWVTDRLGEHLWSKQREILAAVATERFVAVPSCHGVGKSFTAARTVAWWLDIHPPGEAFAVTTAPTFPQVRAILWREIAQAARKGKLLGHLNQTEWLIGNELVAFGRKPSDWNQEAFQGIHARYVLVIIDEACGVPESIWTAAETLVTNADSRILAIGNPDDPTSHFAKICKPNSGWHVMPISAFDSPNFTDEQVPTAIAEQLTSVGWVEERKVRWGENSPLYQAKVLGRFPDQANDALIPLSWIERARERGRARDLTAVDGPVFLGVDVALSGDETVILKLQDGYAAVIEAYRGKDTMETAGHVQLLRTQLDAEARIDAVGIGRGVFDRLAEIKAARVYGLNAGGGAQDREQFINARAEWFWQLRTALDPERPHLDLDPDDELLAEQLSLIRYKITSRGQILIESKDDMRKRGMASPDRADALMLAAAVLPPPTGTFVHAPPEADYRVHISDW